jgi:epoxyqueuosine reductase QueG
LKTYSKEPIFQETEDIHKKAAKLLKALSQNDFKEVLSGLEGSWSGIF